MINKIYYRSNQISNRCIAIKMKRNESFVGFFFASFRWNFKWCEKVSEMRDIKQTIKNVIENVYVRQTVYRYSCLSNRSTQSQRTEFTLVCATYNMCLAYALHIWFINWKKWTISSAVFARLLAARVYYLFL